MRALRRVRECSGHTQATIASRANQAATTLSNHLNGGRVPEPQLLTSFYKVVEEDARDEGAELPHPLNALLEMRLAALKKHCSCCAVGYPADTGESHADEDEAPASRRVQSSSREPGSDQNAAVATGPASSAAARTRVPVPLSQGDRHPKILADEDWSELSILTGYLSEGRHRDAYMVLWSAATTLPSHDVTDVVIACRSAGLDDEANTVLANAGARDAQAVLNIASAFHDRRLYEDAGLLLTSARRGKQEL
ncbi:hypothetical protein [Streptomyces sp. NPDC088400]|uniref:hypothetical protein n=1 Tax=Streptomyces sp. NPDC088400 TaxID=3365861 RepID=UPI0038020261